MPKPLMSPGVADPATTTGRDLRAIIQSPMKKEIVMKDHPRSMHLDLLARARAALASHAEGDADIAEIIADLDTAILSIDRAPVAWSIPVYLATIGHGHGTTNVVAVSYRGLQVQVATFCRSQWGEINDSRDPGSLDDAMVIRDYFNLHPEDQLTSRMEWIDPDFGYDPERLEIGNYIALSSSHISWPTTEKIDEWITLDPCHRPVSIADTHYGWVIATAPSSFGDKSEIPADLFHALTFARGLGCNYLILDRDASTTDRLPCYEG